MSFFAEFKKFAVKGNVIDLAVGVVIGAAFGGITKSLVDDIIMPPLGLAISGIDFSALQLVLRDAVVEDGVVVQEAVAVRYGNFLQVVLNFLIISFSIFLLVRTINRLREKEAPAPPAPAPPPEPPVNKQEVLLAEIRDLLQERPPRADAAAAPQNKVV